MELFSLKEVAEKLGIKSYRLGYLVSNKVIPDTTRIGGRRAWNAEQIEEMRRLLAKYEATRSK